MLQDCCFFETRGLPSVSLLTSAFAPNAGEQVKILEAEGLPRVYVPHPVQGVPRPQMEAKLDAVYEAILAGLEASAFAPPAAEQGPKVECGA